MKAQIRNVDDNGVRYTALMFVCPGCQEPYPLRDSEGNDTGEMHTSSGLHMLPVVTAGETATKSPSWTWDGNEHAPTLSPSILTRIPPYSRDTPPKPLGVCHSFLRVGVFEFLGDCTHSFANAYVPMMDLPDWAVK